jgi:acetylornithine/succinyldiaminopimelate/putrescine aminotransferase
MMEMIQGESGVNPVSEDYVKEVYSLCKEKDIVFICDEVQTGMGRTGKLFAYEHYSITPDIFTLAKALGGGVPIGAVCAVDSIAESFAPGDHGSTFGGNPLACAAANAVFKIFEEEKLVENSARVGAYLKEKLEALSEKCDAIKEVRGKGLMIGVELKAGNAADIKHKLFDERYLVGATATTIRLLPPLVITEKDADDFVKVFEKVLGE